MKLKQKQWIILAVAIGVLVIGVFALTEATKNSGTAPPIFNEARTNGSAIADSIVTLSETSLQTIGKISEEDQKGNTAEALNLVAEEISRNKETRAKAVSLARELQIMTTSLLEIRPDEARQLATEAIGYELTLISQLITYNDYTNQLLTSLQAKFRGTKVQNKAINDAIENMNKTASSINELNNKYRKAMDSFDEYFTK